MNSDVEKKLNFLPNDLVSIRSLLLFVFKFFFIRLWIN